MPRKPNPTPRKANELLDGLIAGTETIYSASRKLRKPYHSAACVLLRVAIRRLRNEDGL